MRDSTHIEFIFLNVRGWLVFAETKNAALFSVLAILSGALLSVEHLDQSLILFVTAREFLYASLASLLVTGVSFFPILKIENFLGGMPGKFNIFFFEHIGSVGLPLYIQELRDAGVYRDECGDSKYNSALVDQIHALSKITRRKLLYFNLSCATFFVVILGLGVT